MTKQEATETLNRVRGMLMHLSMLVQDSETKQCVGRTLGEIGDIEDLLGIGEVHSDDEDYDDENEDVDDEE